MPSPSAKQNPTADEDLDYCFMTITTGIKTTNAMNEMKRYFLGDKKCYANIQYYYFIEFYFV